MDWMALDSAAALAMLCHTLEEPWEVGWRASLSDSDNIIAYAWNEGERFGEWHLGYWVQAWEWGKKFLFLNPCVSFT